MNILVSEEFVIIIVCVSNIIVTENFNSYCWLKKNSKTVYLSE